MPLLAYDTYRPRGDARTLIRHATEFGRQYRAQGYRLTLRQLYYRMVAADLIPNTQESYDRVGEILSRARMAGMFDWNTLEDRTRNPYIPWGSSGPDTEIANLAAGYQIQKWETQPYHVEVWVEKQALEDVIGRACSPLQLPYLACRGYMSQSEMWSCSRRFLRALQKGKRVRILHLGDHDPSGMDMTRDIRERLEKFLVHDYIREARSDSPAKGATSYAHLWSAIGEEHGYKRSPFAVDRIALNMDQIREFNPPPNPAKVTDSRFESYRERFGSESWELDALEPAVLAELIRDSTLALRDEALWTAALAKESREAEWLQEVADSYADNGFES